MMERNLFIIKRQIMIKLKHIIKEEVDKRELKKQVKIASDALNVFSKAINEFVNIFVRYHNDAGKAVKDPVFVMINRIINIKGKVNKLVAWKKHLAHLDKKL